jgi:hypothetical protein
MTTLGVVPDQYVYLLKDITVFNQSGTSRAIVLWSIIDGLNYVMWHIPSVTGGQSITSAGRSLVMPPGAILGMSAGVAGLTGLYICGARLGHS